MMNFTVCTEFSEDLRADWNVLLTESVTHVPFLRFEYLVSWWQTRGGGEWPQDAQLCLVSAERDGQLVGIAPLFFARETLWLLGSVEVDRTRLATEVAIFADKASIDEEISRLRSHIAQMRTLLADSEPSGRKLDFVVQEMNREFNTIGSKANDGELTKLVLTGKAEIEKIREQVQNIE